MRRLFLFITLIASIHISNAQVGIGTTNPEGALDVVAVDQGIIVPRVSAVENVTTPDGGPAIDGTIVYDLSRNQMCRRISGTWACSSATGTTTTIFTESYSTISNYIKASNTDNGDNFGGDIAISADGNTLVVGAIRENSNATGVNGDQTDNSSNFSGAVYVYTRAGGVWSFDTYLKASNTDSNDFFGSAVSVNSNGTQIAVSARGEDGGSTGINGDETDNSMSFAGAAYVFNKSGGVWAQEAYIKASNTGAGDNFGVDIALSDDGTRLVVGAFTEGSSATGVNGDQTDNSALAAGAIYVFVRTGGMWTQEAYIKASNTDASDRFGRSVAIDNTGTHIIVGADFEDSASKGVNSNSADDSLTAAGAAYVFSRAGTSWSQDAYIKASNTDANDNFGVAVSISGDGSAIVVGARGEDSNAIGVNGDQTNNDLSDSGAAYIFTNNGSLWSQSSYIKASLPGLGDTLGSEAELSQNGEVLIVCAVPEDSNATGLNGDQEDNSASIAGAAYSFVKLGTEWAQSAYIKASNTEASDRFGSAIALNADGTVVAISALTEASNATGVGGDQTDNSAANAGAVYIVE